MQHSQHLFQLAAVDGALEHPCSATRHSDPMTKTGKVTRSDTVTGRNTVKKRGTVTGRDTVTMRNTVTGRDTVIRTSSHDNTS